MFRFGSAFAVPGSTFGDSSTTSFAWNYGGGVKAALNDRIGVRADLRYFNASDVAPDHFRIYGGVVIRRIGQ